MAIKTPEELRTALSGVLGDTPSDAGLTLMEDFSDTLASLTGSGSAHDWEQKYKDNDAAWRKRYIERFNAPANDDNDGKPTDKNDNKTMSFESLFKEV